MSRSTISTFKLFEMFPDEETARKYLESRLWKDGVTCPKCKGKERIGTRKGGYYRCHVCKLDFTVRTGTIFERSHVPLHKWLYAMYLLVTARKGISSMQLAKEIGITQKSAWFVLHRLREACSHDLSLLKGTIQADEIYVGGREQTKHMRKRVKYQACGASEKTPILAMRENGGRTRGLVLNGVSAFSIQQAIRQNVEIGSTVHTDEFAPYKRLTPDYQHQTVNHSQDEYYRNGVTTNAVESVFAVMRRGLHGVYHKASKKHLHRYVDEFTWRLSDGHVKRHSLERLDSFVDAATGKRITYKRLIQKV